LRVCIQQSAWIAKVNMPAQYHELPTKLSKLSGEDLSPAIFRQQVAKACIKIHIPNQTKLTTPALLLIDFILSSC